MLGKHWSKTQRCIFKWVLDYYFTFLTIGLLCNVAVSALTASAKLQSPKFNTKGDIFLLKSLFQDYNNWLGETTTSLFPGW